MSVQVLLVEDDRFLRKAAESMVILTNLGQEADVARAMTAGAAAYFIKSNTSLSNLVEQVRLVLDGQAA